jgi:large subunit ribosomal protein L2
MRRVRSACRATIGQLGNLDWINVSIGKAGRNRHRGVRPHTRAKAMNPIDHPLGGGEGPLQRRPPPGEQDRRARQGRHHAHPKKHSDKLILRRRKFGKAPAASADREL